MFMVFFVLDDPDQLNAVLDAWKNVGVAGVTIIESTGLNRVQHHFIPMRYVSAVTSRERNNLTLMAIVTSEAQVQACLAAAEEVTGDLDNPNTGILAAWPLSIVKGLPPSEG